MEIKFFYYGHVICLTDRTGHISNAGQWNEADHPRKKDGKFEKSGTEVDKEKEDKEIDSEIQRKIDSVKIDFTKDNFLPELNAEDLEEIGVESKPVRLKKHIINRNAFRHSDVSDDEASSLIGKALYSPKYIVPGKREGAYHFISKSEAGKSSLVLLDIEQSEDGYFDIVHFFKVREKSKKALIK